MGRLSQNSAFLPACLALFLSFSCTSYVELVVRIQARAEQKDPVVTYFDNRSGLRFTDRARGVRRRVLFLSRQRLAALIRRLFPSGRAPKRTPDSHAIEMHFLNYGAGTLRVDFRDFRIRDKKTGKEAAPLAPREYDRTQYGRGMAGLPYAWAFEQKDSFVYHLAVPDWFAASRARRTGSSLEYQMRRERAWSMLEAEHERRTRVLPGREVKGIVLFPLLPPGRDYVLEYRSSGTGPGRFSFEPFHFRLKLVRGAKPAGGATKRRVWRAFQKDDSVVRRETAEYFRMHEQLREHDGLRSKR